MLMVKREGEAFAQDPQKRGLRAAYWSNQVNYCPSCSRSQWLVGRSSAECAFCATALPLERSFTPTAAEDTRNLRTALRPPHP
jgi:hypothetical protein